MTNVTSLRLRVLPRFPSSLQGTDGITVVREGGGLIVKPDFSQLAEVTNIPNTDDTLFMAWNRETNEYSTVPYGAFFGNAGTSFGYPTRALAEVATILDGIHAIEVFGDVTVGDGLGGVYIDSDNGSDTTFVSGDGRTWYLAADVGEDRLVDALQGKLNGAMQKSAYDPTSKGGDVFPYASKVEAAAATIPASRHTVYVDGLGPYSDTDTGSTDTFTSSGGTARTFYRVADVGFARLDTVVSNAIGRPGILARYRKRVAANLPISGGVYDTIVVGYDSILPQAWTVDWTGKYIFILKTQLGGTIDKFWIEVWSYSALTPIGFRNVTYVSTFNVQISGITYSEGIEVIWEAGNRFLYVQNATNSLAKFNLNVIPSDFATLAPGSAVANYSVGLHSQFSYRNGKWLIQQEGPTVGAENRRNNYAIYDSTLSTRIGSVVFENDDVGPWTASALADYIPKAQNVAIGDGFYFASMGGFHGEGTVPSIPYSYQGIKIFNSDGVLLDENIVEPEAMIDIIQAAGYVCHKLEYEGAVQAPDGRIFGLLMTLSPTASAAPDNKTTGILLIEEFANGEGVIDFSSAARVYPKIDIARWSSGIWPRSRSGKIHNPWTGAELTTWEQICDMMRSMDVPRLAYYTSATTGVAGIAAEVIPGGCLVELLNHDNQSWTVNIFGSGFQRLYRVFGTAGSRSVTRRTVPIGGQRGVFAAEVQAVGGLTVSIADGNYFDVATQTAAGTLVISPTNSIPGQTIKIKRRGGAFNLVVQDGAGATITTLTANQNAELMMGSSQYYLWQ